MKIFDAAASREADKTTVQNQGITYYDLMERAGNEAFLWLRAKFPDKSTPFHIVCGQGNNGGDGLVIARLLHNEGYSKITVEIIENAGRPTPSFLENRQRLEEKGDLYSNLSGNHDGGLVIIDAIFGIGLTREPEGGAKTAIDDINNKKAYVVAIDVPSGMFMDRQTTFAVKADVVLTFQQPKLSFYLSQNYRFINEVEILDIGLDREFIDNYSTDYYLTNHYAARKIYKPVSRFAHKGTQGHALIIGGSYGKIGAVSIAAKSALKSGCGLVTAYIPKCGYTVLQSYLPEAMVLTGGEENITDISFSFEAKAVGIGPGMGQDSTTQKAFFKFLTAYNYPLVIDADALNILSCNKEWLAHVPANSIVTPHPKELERLIGVWQDDFEKLEKVKAFSRKYNIIVVVKDAYTMVIYKNEVHINNSGNEALATGGSGDALTGIITGLLSQSYKPLDAAVLGVYLHGLTADIAVRQTGVQAFTASMIADYIGQAFLRIEKK